MDNKQTAIMLINRMTINRQSLSNPCTQKEFDAERKAFLNGCKELAQIQDGDVQQVLSILMRDRGVHNLASSAAWKRLISN